MMTLFIIIIGILKSNYLDSINRIDDRIFLTTSSGEEVISTVNPCSSTPSVSRSWNCDLSIPAFMKWSVRFSMRSLIREGEPERWMKYRRSMKKTKDQGPGFETLMAENMKKDGNKSFKLQNYQIAIKQYNKIIAIHD